MCVGGGGGGGGGGGEDLCGGSKEVTSEGEQSDQWRPGRGNRQRLVPIP